MRNGKTEKEKMKEERKDESSGVESLVVVLSVVEFLVVVLSVRKISGCEKRSKTVWVNICVKEEEICDID